MQLELTHYAKKEIYAYVCPLTIKGSQIKRGDFINGQPREADKQRFYQGKSAIVVIDLDNLDDGLYEYKEASGHKTRFGYFELTGGTIGREWDTSQEMIEDLKPIPELPELEGSSKQVSWAENIRAGAIRDGILPEWAAAKSTRARDWIDNRDRITFWFWDELEEEGR